MALDGFTIGGSSGGAPVASTAPVAPQASGDALSGFSIGQATPKAPVAPQAPISALSGITLNEPVGATPSSDTSIPDGPDIPSMIVSTKPATDTSSLFSGFKDSTDTSTPKTAIPQAKTSSLVVPSVSHSGSGVAPFSTTEEPALTNPKQISDEEQNLNSMEHDLKVSGADLDAQSTALESSRTSVDTTDQSSVDSFNASLKNYQDSVAAYNSKYASYKSRLDNYNKASGAMNTNAAYSGPSLTGASMQTNTGVVNDMKEAILSTGAPSWLANNPIVNTIGAAYSDLQGKIHTFSKNTNGPPSSQIGQALDIVVAVGNLLFSPVNAVIKTAESDHDPVPFVRIPVKAADAVIGGFFKNGVNIPIQDAIQALPISQQVKDNIKQPIADFFTALSMLALGKVVDDVGVPVIKEKIADVKTLITKDLITTHFPSSTVYFDIAKVRDIWQTGKLLTPAERGNIMKTLGKTPGDIRAAMENGVTIGVDARTLTILQDKPYWSKIKSFFGIEPEDAKVISDTGGKPSVTVRGYLQESNDIHPVLKDEIKSAIDQHGSDVTTQALHDNLGIEPGEASKLVSRATRPSNDAELAEASEKALAQVAPEAQKNTPGAKAPMGSKQSAINVGGEGIFERKTTIEGSPVTDENKKVSYSKLNIPNGKQPISFVRDSLAKEGVPSIDIDSILSRTPRINGQTWTDNVFDAVTAHNDAVREHNSAAASLEKEKSEPNTIEERYPGRTIPLRGQELFHGTDADFDRFDGSKSKTGPYKGIHLADTREAAAAHGETVHAPRITGKFFDLGNSAQEAQIIKNNGGSEDALQKNLEKEGYDGVKRGTEYVSFKDETVNKGFHNTEGGLIALGKIYEDIAGKVKEITDLINRDIEVNEKVDTVTDTIYKTEGLAKSNRQRLIQLVNEYGSMLSAQGWENLYHYDENHSEPLTAEEKKIYDQVIKPLKDALTKARKAYRNLGGVITEDLDPDIYTPRLAKEKGGPIDRIIRDVGKKTKNVIRNGGLLSKSLGPGSKRREYHIGTTADGKETVLHIPSQQKARVTGFKNGKATDLGPKKGNISGGKFTDKNGVEYTIREATTKEIEAHTSTRYHKNVLANYIISYDRTLRALNGMRLLNKIKDSKTFGDIIAKDDPNESIPEGWESVGDLLPQFRGFSMEPKLAEALSDFAQRQKGKDHYPILDEVNNILTAAIVLNPIMHFPNVAVGWMTSESGTGVIPGLTTKSRKNFITAVNEVRNKGPLYLSYLEHGAPFMSLKESAKNFTDAILTQYTEQVIKDPSQWQELSERLGYANPVRWFKGLGKINENITWGGNDIMFMHALMDHSDRNGTSMEESIKEVSKRMADYRIPSRVGPGKLGRLASKTLQNRAFLFSRYHYSGVIKPWIEALKDTAGPKASAKQRMAGLRVLAYLALMGFIVYPYIDKLLRGITGKPTTYLSMAGPVKFIQTGIPGAIQSTLTLNPVISALAELEFNRDLYTWNPIYGPLPAEGMTQFSMSLISPLSSADRLSPGDFALSFFGIYTPKSTPAKNALLSQKYDELPALEVQVKKDIAAGDVAKANAEMKDFNTRAIANYNQYQLDINGTPLPADGSENQAFLKEWGIKAPGAKAVANASALYGDGSLTSKSSLIDSVFTYAKAIGTDPMTAFSRIFTGQKIVRVDNTSFLSLDAAVIVERDDQSESDARSELGKQENKTPDDMKDLQLDHIIPLEDGGTNDISNYQLTSTYNNEVLHGLVENPISAALKAGTISRAKAREYLIRYKAGTLGEALTPAMLSEYKDKYGSQPITPLEVQQAIDSGQAK